MRRAAKRDAVEAEIVEAWAAAGGYSFRVSEKGLPDLVLWHPACGGFVLAEVKRPKGGKLTPAQVRFRETWRGPQPVILRSVQDALDLLRIVRYCQTCKRELSPHCRCIC